MYRLLIDNENVELNVKGLITLNKVIIDISDLEKRGINYTNAFTIPFTSKNDRLTGYPSRLSSNNRAFEVRKNYILTDNSSIISRGNVIVKSFNDKKGIKIQLVEGSDFWNVAGSKLLYDLTIHDNDFLFNVANMNALKTKTSSVFVTALHSATGDGNNTALTNYNATRPCYNFKILLDKIISELGYEVDYGNVLDRTDILNLGCLSNCEQFFVSDFKRRFENSVQLGNIDYTAATSVFSKAGNVSQSGAVLTNAAYETSYVFKGFVDSAIDTQITLQIDGDTEVINVPKGRSFVNFKTDTVEVGTGFTVNFPTALTLEDVYIYSAINEADIFAVDNTIAVDGFLVLADYNLPQQTWKRFIKNIITLNFLNFTIDENKKKITFEYLPDIINTNNVVDFSGKLERYFTIERGDVYGQISIFLYNNDENINKDKGAAYINIQNENAPELKEVIKINEFSASQEITVSTNNILLVDIYDTVTNERNSVTDRILLFKDEGTFGINATFTGISWQRLYSRHYLSFIQATKKERLISFTGYLNTLDFRTLQKNPIIYVDFLQANFLVTEIEGFQRNGKVKLKCIKYN